MFIQYFGHYLLNKGYINTEQLKDILEYEKHTRVKVGILAMDAGLMSLDQIEMIHKEQAKVDKKFGEIAIEQGILTVDQLNKLLENQRKGHLVLAQCLVDRNYMTLGELQDAMSDYARTYHLSTIEELEQEEIISKFLDFGETLWGKTYSDYISLLLRNFARFIDDVPVITISRVDNEFSAKWLVSQKIYGKFSMFTSISSDDAETLTHFSELFTKEKYTSFDAYAQDAVSEFLNLHNGLFLVNMSNNDVNLNIEPQQIEENKMLKDLPECYKIKLTWLWGTMNMIIF